MSGMELSLRGKIAMEADATIVEKLGDAFEWDHWHTERDECAALIADRILAIPEIADALAALKPDTP